jgi:hypothetical protein
VASARELTAASAGFDPRARERLSLCMIVRDEEKRLARCLASALPWVGEAVVVDTGSKDATAALAAAHGARVLRFAWCDDFSRARNHALDAATRDWALVLDADEVLAVDDAAAWARALTAAPATDAPGASSPGVCSPDAYSIDCHDRLDDGGVAVGPVLRLFRRGAPGMRYRGEVHEQIAAVADRRCATAHARFLHIDHDGHTGAVVAEHRTVARNLALARTMSASRPGDPFAWFCLGQALQAADAVSAEAIEAYGRALDRLAARGAAHRDESYLAALWIGLTRVLLRAGRAGEALAAATQALRDFPDAPDLRFLRGKMLLDGGDPAAAARDFEACLTPAAARFFLRQDPGAAGYAAETQLAICWVKLGQTDRAREALQRAAEAAPPAFHLPRQLLAMLRLARGDAAGSEALLAAIVRQRPDDADARLYWARALLALGRRADARDALAPLASDPRAARLLGC